MSTDHLAAPASRYPFAARVALARNPHRAAINGHIHPSGGTVHVERRTQHAHRAVAGLYGERTRRIVRDVEERRPIGQRDDARRRTEADGKTRRTVQPQRTAVRQPDLSRLAALRLDHRDAIRRGRRSLLDKPDREQNRPDATGRARRRGASSRPHGAHVLVR
jgi:hypothetical protein